MRALRWVALVVLALVLAVALARLFSGPEDTWVKDASGRWVAHGHPAGPPPSHPAAADAILPWTVLGAAALGLGAALLLSARPRATRAALHRDLRFYHAVSLVSGVLAAALLLGLGATVAVGLGAPAEVTLETLLVLLGLLGLLCFLAVLSVHTNGTKRVLEAHYDLKRATDRLQETIDRLNQSLPKSGAP